MSRYLLTKLRATPLSKFLALDQSIEFHKAIGVLCMVLSLIHTIAHLAHLAYHHKAKGEEYLMKLFWVHADTHMFGWFGTAYPTGLDSISIKYQMGHSHKIGTSR
eukprot:sb/3477900/